MESPDTNLKRLLSETLGAQAFEHAAAEDAALGNNQPRSVTGPPPQFAPHVAMNAPAGPTPEPVPATPAAQPAVPSSQPTPEPRLLMGKYKDEKEAEKGYYELLRYNKALLEERDSLKAAVSTPAPTYQTAPAANPQPVSVNEKFKQLEEVTGIDAGELQSTIMELVRAGSREVAETTYKSFTEPEKRIKEADNFMNTNYPDALRFQDEIVQFAQTDPVTREMVSALWDKGLYKEAMVASHNAWKLSNAAQVEHNLLVAEEVRKDEVAQARQDAGLVNTTAQGAREQVNVGPSAEEMDALVRAKRAGYGTPWLRATIGRTLPDAMFGGSDG